MEVVPVVQDQPKLLRRPFVPRVARIVAVTIVTRPMQYYLLLAAGVK